MVTRSASQRSVPGRIQEAVSCILVPAVLVCSLTAGGLGLRCNAKFHGIESFFRRRCGATVYLVAEWWINDGAWLLMLHEPNTRIFGILFLCFYTFAQLPYVISDIQDGAFKRAFIALVGLRCLQKYKGLADSPEVDLINMVCAKVPVFIITAVAAGEKTDVLTHFHGEEGQFILTILMVLYILVFGGSVAFVTDRLVDVTRQRVSGPSSSLEERLENSIGEMIDGSLGRLVSFMCHALDALAFTFVMAAVALKYSRIKFALYFLCFWFVCGLLPALVAPPPMPTLRPALPTSCCGRLVHRTVVSFLMCCFPPTEYLPLLSEDKQLVWAFFAILRVGFLMATSMLVPSKVPVGPDCFRGWMSVFSGLVMVRLCNLYGTSISEGHDSFSVRPLLTAVEYREVWSDCHKPQPTGVCPVAPTWQRGLSTAVDV